MCPTRTRLALQQAVDAVGGKVIDVGDHRQTPSVDVGGGHYALAQRLGASELGENHRFRDPVYRDAAELLRDRQASAAVELLRAQGAVSDDHVEPVGAWQAMVNDWLAHRDNGESALMLATERATVAQLNQLSRAHLVSRGDVSSRTRTYRSPDDARRIGVAVGDQVILRRNDARMPQHRGQTIAVRNGMTGRVTTTSRRGVTVELDDAHRTPNGPVSVTLPAGYVGEHVDYGYARTVDTAQGATVDHSLFTPSAATSAERAYVALSRGRSSNRVYATKDRGWVDAIGDPRSHTLATDQQPDRDRGAARDRDTDRRTTRTTPTTAELPTDLAAGPVQLRDTLARDVAHNTDDEPDRQPHETARPTTRSTADPHMQADPPALPDDLAERREALTTRLTAGHHPARDAEDHQCAADRSLDTADQGEDAKRAPDVAEQTTDRQRADKGRDQDISISM